MFNINIYIYIYILNFIYIKNLINCYHKFNRNNCKFDLNLKLI